MLSTVATPTRGYSKAFQAAIDGPADERATPADAFAAAREEFVACRRIEMRELADKLGVSRTTIYNWCGDRDQLLVDVLWSIAHEVLEVSWAKRSSLTGAARFHAVCEDVFTTLAAAPPLQALLRNETHAALRLLTGRHGVHDRFVAYIVERIAEEEARGAMRLDARPEDLAEGMVTVIESGLYNDNIAAVEPEIDRAMALVALLLRGAERSAS